MSKVTETTSTEISGNRKGREWSPSFNRTLKFYDENFDYKEEKVTGSITPAVDLQSAYALGLSQEEMVLALNNAAKAKLFAEKSEAVMGSNAVSESALNNFIAPWRFGPSFAKITNKAEQTKAIIAKLKNDPDAIAALRAAAVDTSADTE